MGQLAGRESPLAGVRVLLVEDHPVVRDVISRLLVDFGAGVTATAEVAEALEAFERERPDVVLSDIDMVDEDGYALIRKLRALPRDRGGQTPVAGLTGLSSVEDRARVLQAGFQCYVAKPVDARMLVSVVASLAARGGVARRGAGEYGPASQVGARIARPAGTGLGERVSSQASSSRESRGGMGT
jgi:CheY-like chemotaxis protein